MFNLELDSKLVTGLRAHGKSTNFVKGMALQLATASEGSNDRKKGYLQEVLAFCQIQKDWPRTDGVPEGYQKSAKNGCTLAIGYNSLQSGTCAAFIRLNPKKKEEVSTTAPATETTAPATETTTANTVQDVVITIMDMVCELSVDDFARLKALMATLEEVPELLVANA